MENIDPSTAPLEFLRHRWLLAPLQWGYGVGHMVCFAALIFQAYRDRSYGLPMVAACNNLAWEITYIVLYDCLLPREFVIWPVLSTFVMYSSMKFSPNEWNHAPFVQSNIRIIWLVVFAAFFSFHQMAVAHFGSHRGVVWTGWFSQAILSTTALSQLLSRGSSRGMSYTIWLSRFLGTNCATARIIVLVYYWPQAFSWASNPLMWWVMCFYFTVDVAYGICFWHIRREQKRLEESGRVKAKQG